MSRFSQSALYTKPHHIHAWFKINTTRLNSLSFLALILLCFIYIVQVNHSVSKGYQIRDLESQIQELTMVNQKLEVSTQQAQALTNVARATKMLGLVRADQLVYVKSGGPSYALAE